MENVLVTGGAGFLGQNIVRALLAEGKSVRIMDNFSTGSRKATSELKEAAGGKLLVAENPIESMAADDYKDIDTIFHFGSPCSMRQFTSAPVQSMQTTIASFTSVMELAKKNNAMVIYPSSGSIYGNVNKIQKESDTPMPVNLYGLAKITSEQMAAYYERLYGIRSMGFRIFASYGIGERQKGDLASAVTLFLEKLLRDEQPEIWGDGLQSRDFIFVDDVVKMLIKGAKDPKAKVLNVGSGESTTFNRVVEVLDEILGKSIKPKYIPKPPNYLENTRADISLARSLYEFSPRSFRDGVKSYIDHELSKK